jgi:hypothetical protein
VSMDVGIYNVQKATCNGICPTCMGFTSGSIAVDPFAVPIGGQTQETLYMQMGSAGQNTVPATNWASTNTSMATVSSGMVTGVGVGSPMISSNSQFQEAVFVPFDCNSFCPTGFVAGSTLGSVTPPPTVTFSPIAGVAVGMTANITATVSIPGGGANTTPISLAISPPQFASEIPPAITTTTLVNVKGLQAGVAHLTATIPNPGGGPIVVGTTSFTVVTAIPINFSSSPGTMLLNGSLFFTYQFQSSSGNLADLSSCRAGESVFYPNFPTATFTWPLPMQTNKPSPNPTRISGAASSGGFEDTNQPPDSYKMPYGPANFPATQRLYWTCPTWNGGSINSFVPDITIARRVFLDTDSLWKYQITKSGYMNTIVLPGQ